MANEIRNAFNVVYSDGPSGTPDMPSKPDIRQVVGGTIQTQFDGLASSVADVGASLSEIEDQIADIETGSTDGVIVASTKANLDAQAVSKGLGPDDSGRGGRVYGDSNAALNGDYGWTGSSWSLLGADRIGKVEAATGAPLGMSRDAIIYDPQGLLSGGVQTVYVTRRLYARIGSTVANGSAFGTPSSPFPTHVALAITSVNPTTIYLDLDDTSAPQKISNWPALPPTSKPDKIEVIAEVFQGRIKTAYPVVHVEDLDKEHLSFVWPVAVDDKVRVPAVYHYAPNTGFTLYSPPNGELYWEFDLNTAGNSEWRYYFDRIAAEASQTPFKVANSGTTRPLAMESKAVILEIGRSINGRFDSDYPCVGRAGLGSVPNMLVHGDDPDAATLYDADLTVPVAITEPNLVAMGFTRGYGGTRPMPRLLLDEGTPKKGWIKARLAVQASADDVFQTPMLYVHDGRGANLTQFTFQLEKKLSARAAIYSRMVPYDLAESPASITAGLLQGTTNPVALAGVQIYVGPKAMPYIMRGDYGRKVFPDFLYPPKHFSVSGRELPFFRQGMIGDRGSDEILSVLRPGAALADVPVCEEIGEGTRLNYSRFGSTLKMHLGPPAGNVAQRVVASVQNIRASGAMSGAFNVLVLGDSNTARGQPSYIKAKLQAMGFTPSMVGTMQDELNGEYGEGRGSWEWRDFSGADPQFPLVAAGGESAYLALAADNANAAGRWGRNPLLNPSTGAFDFAGYLSRFSVASPKFVPVLLGTNDFNQYGPDAALAQIQAAMTAILPNLLSALPSSFIGVGMMPLPRAVVEETKWRSAYVQGIRQIMKFVADTASARLDVLPVWAHMSPNFGWAVQAKQTLQGRTIGEVTDGLHMSSSAGINDDTNRSLAAEVVAQWIACKQMGL